MKETCMHTYIRSQKRWAAVEGEEGQPMVERKEG